MCQTNNPDCSATHIARINPTLIRENFVCTLPIEEDVQNSFHRRAEKSHTFAFGHATQSTEESGIAIFGVAR